MLVEKRSCTRSTASITGLGAPTVSATRSRLFEVRLVKWRVAYINAAVVQNQTLPLILTFGVSDPVGALGVQADLAAFAAHGCHGLSVVAGLLVADSAKVENLHEVDSDWMADQARVLLEDMPVAAFKVGA